MYFTKATLLLVLWVGLCASPTSAVAQKLSFEEEIIQKYQKDSDYDYSVFEVSESTWDQFKTWIGRHYNRLMRWLFGDYEASSVLAFFIKIFPYLIVVGIFILFIYLFVKYNWGKRIFNEPDAPSLLFSEEEEIIRRKDIDQLIEKALQKKNYRLAIRYQYLKSLRFLEEGNMIRYEFSKTNQDYIAELQQHPVSHLFSEITRYYDYAWYGGFSVSLAQYQNMDRNFRAFVQQLQPKTNG